MVYLEMEELNVNKTVSKLHALSHPRFDKVVSDCPANV